MNSTPTPTAHRILIVDDNPSIHDDFRKILMPQGGGVAHALAEAKALIFGDNVEPVPEAEGYTLDFAFQGEQAVRLFQRGVEEHRRHAMAFVDVRMPPGWDGIETIEHLWKVDPSLQVVICTAYSDYSWEDIARRLPAPENLLILKKPFDKTAVLQMVSSLTRKHDLERETQERVMDAELLASKRAEQLNAAVCELHAKTEAHAEVQQALIMSEERFSKSFQCSPLPLALQTASDRRYVDVNESFLATLGLRREAVLGRTPEEAGVVFQMEAAAAHAMAHGLPPREVECRIGTSNGVALHALLSVEMLTLSGTPHLLTSLQDITRQVRIEGQMRQAQKLDTIGQFTMGIAHDFNNLLTVIQLHASLHAGQSGLPGPVRNALNGITHASERAAELTRQLLNYSRRRSTSAEPVDLSALAGRLAPLLSRLLGEEIELQMLCDPKLPRALVDAAAITQILMNLAANARDAMKEGGGRLTILTTVTELDEAAARAKGLAHRKFIRLSVADTGCGMDARTRDRIFEPFFTTKPLGEGTGLGLSTVFDLVKKHHGWVEVHSDVGRGTVIAVLLPQADDAAASGQSGPPPDWQLAQRPQLRGRVVLLVEDDPLVRRVMKELITKLGCVVQEASTVQEARDLWSQHRGRIWMLLTDLSLPGGTGGLALAEDLARERGDLKIAYTSGYRPDMVEGGQGLQADVNFLPKPCSPAMVESLLLRALETEACRPIPSAMESHKF